MFKISMHAGIMILSELLLKLYNLYYNYNKDEKV